MSEGKKSKKWPVAVFAVGFIVLVVGLTMLIVKLVSGPAVADAEFLVANSRWVREDEPSVVWNFTEVGKGSLTTDGDTTNYDFIWKLDGDKLKIETKWLYDLNDEFNYVLNQGDKTLTISSDETEVKFKVVEKSES